MRDSETSPSSADHPRASMWSWLKIPWVMLVVGTAMIVVFGVAVHAWIRWQYRANFKELHARSSAMIRYQVVWPEWLPPWLIKELPDDWDGSEYKDLDVTFLRPPDSKQLQLLNRLPDVNKLTFLDPSALSDQDVLRVIEAHDLEELSFYPARTLTPQHLAALIKKQSRLSTLVGVKGPFDQKALDAFSQLPQLKALKLDGAAPESGGIAGLRRLSHLSHLSWSNSQLTDDQIPDLMLFPALKSVSLADTQLTAGSWPVLKSLPLMSLELESPHLDDRVIEDAISPATLRMLSLRGGSISDQGLEQLLAKPELTSLRIETRGLTRAACKLLCEDRNLKWLTLYGGPHIDNEWLAELARGQFETLSVVNSSITDEGVVHLSGKESLYHLGLPGSQITDQGLLMLSKINQLTSLDLRYTAITDEGLQQLETTGLRWLDLRGTRVTTGGVRTFKRRMPLINVSGVEGTSDCDYDFMGRHVLVFGSGPKPEKALPVWPSTLQ